MQLLELLCSILPPWADEVLNALNCYDEKENQWDKAVVWKRLDLILDVQLRFPSFFFLLISAEEIRSVMFVNIANTLKRLLNDKARQF